MPYDSIQFRQYRKEALEIIEGIEVILEEARKGREKALEESTPATNSLADEIIKLKSLFDQGIISEDEFNKGKSKLLEKQ